MKQVLSLLTAFVFLQMQTWALSGGPVYDITPNLAGTYSGVMVQTNAKFGIEFQAPNDARSTPNEDQPAGNIGVFTLSVLPAGGLTNGNSVIFINGTIFPCTITGLADPDRGTFQGIITGTGNLVQTVTATGQMKTKIKEKQNTPLPGRTSTAQGNAAKIEGTAKIDASEFVNFNLTPRSLIQAKYTVSGFRQITTPLP